MGELVVYESVDTDKKGLRWDNGSYQEYMPAPAWLATEIERLQQENRDLHELADHYRQENLRRGEALEAKEALADKMRHETPGHTVYWHMDYLENWYAEYDALTAMHEAEQAAPQGEVKE